MTTSPSERGLQNVSHPRSAHPQVHPLTSTLDIPPSATFPSQPLVTAAHALSLRGDGDESDEGLKCLLLPPGCEEGECTLTHCVLPSSSLYWPTSSIRSGTTTGVTSTYYTTVTTGSPQYSETATGSGSSSPGAVGTSVPSKTSDTDVSNCLTPEQIAGIVVGSVLGAVLLGLFFWLLRRGTFGSGTLFGFRYGAARYPGWRPDGGVGQVGTEMVQERRKGDDMVTAFEPLNSMSTSLPSYPSSTLTVAASAESTQPFLPHAKLRSSSPSILSDAHAPPPPPRSPTAWSTSPSAFDNAYGSIVAPSTTGGSSVAGSGSRNAPSERDAMSVSEVSTLVSDVTGRSFPSTSAVLSYTPTPPPSHSHPHPHPHPHPIPTPHSRWESMMSAPTALPLPMRGQSPAPTMSTGTGSDRSATSTVDGVRISSWHSSDSEETELIGRGQPRR